MKKPILVTALILICFLNFNCKQHKGQGGPGYQGQTQGPVPNVNGNKPDTTNTVNMPAGSNTDTDTVTNRNDTTLKK
jgi:hypothetical protein